MNARAIMPLLAGALVLASVEACYGATEIRLTVDTDVACKLVRQNGIVITGAGKTSALATTPSLAESTTCNGGASGQNALGDLVFVPSGGTPDLVIRVVLGVTVPTSSCLAGPRQGCIVADRKLSYGKHESRTIRIRLSSACAGVVCAEGETCEQGTCISPAAVCSGTDCGGTVIPVVDGGAILDSGTVTNGDGGGTIANDAGIPPVSCLPPGCSGCQPGQACCVKAGGDLFCGKNEQECRENGIPATYVCRLLDECTCPSGSGKCEQIKDGSCGGKYPRVCGGSCAALE